jgi:nitrogen fixation protein NifU and related proteins
MLMVYADRVLDYYNNPRNAGTLDRMMPNVGTGLIHVPEYIEVVRIQVAINPATNRITEARFKTFGSGVAIAVSSFAAEWIQGKTIDQAARIDHMDLVTELNLPPAKVHCAFLAEDAVKAAINDYLLKNGLEPLAELTDEEEEEAEYYEEEEA